MSHAIDVLKYAKKAVILNQILFNYRHERQALQKRDVVQFRRVLKIREHLIDQLRALHLTSPDTPLLYLQKKNIDRLVAKIQIERDEVNKFFPH